MNDLAAAQTLFLRTTLPNHRFELTYQEALAAVYQLTAAIARAEASGTPRAEILVQIAEARRAAAIAPFVERMQTWPRGYPGDFETIEYLLAGNNTCPPNTLAHFIEEYCLNSAACQQHQNKVIEQAMRILRTAESTSNARILVLACGGCPDVALVRDFIPNHCQLVLTDADADALVFSRARLGSTRFDVRYIQGNALRIAARVRDLGRFDLVLIGGLFDYLADRAAAHVLRDVCERILTPTGAIFFTNISPTNPDRVWLEYIGNWVLTPRTDAELVGLCLQAGVPAERVRIQRDRTRITRLVEVLGPDQGSASTDGPVSTEVTTGVSAVARGLRLVANTR